MAAASDPARLVKVAVKAFDERARTIEPSVLT